MAKDRRKIKARKRQPKPQVQPLTPRRPTITAATSNAFMLAHATSAVINYGDYNRGGYEFGLPQPSSYYA